MGVAKVFLYFYRPWHTHTRACVCVWFLHVIIRVINIEIQVASLGWDLTSLWRYSWHILKPYMTRLLCKGNNHKKIYLVREITTGYHHIVKLVSISKMFTILSQDGNWNSMVTISERHTFHPLGISTCTEAILNLEGHSARFCTCVIWSQSVELM